MAGEKLDAKTLMIIAVPIVAIFLVYVLFFYGKNNTKKVESTEIKNDVAVPNSNDTVSENSKLNAYEQYQKDQSEKQALQASKSSEDDFFNDDGSKKPAVDSTEIKKQQEKEKVRVVYRDRPKKKGPEPAPEPVVEKKISGGFGIYTSSSVSNKAVKGNNNSYVPVILEEDTKISHGVSVIFILKEDFNYNGTLFKKNAILYGKAVENGGVFDINFSSIKNTDNKMYEASGLAIYSKDYSKGIAFDGGVNDAVKEGTNQSAGETPGVVGNPASGTLGGKALDVGINALDNTVRALTSKKKNSITLDQGYKAFIKKEI